MVKRNVSGLQNEIESLRLMIEKKTLDMRREIDAQAERIRYMNMQLHQSEERSQRVVNTKRQMIQGWLAKCERLEGIIQRTLVENGNPSASSASSDGTRDGASDGASDGTSYTERLLSQEQTGSSEPQGITRVEDET